MLEMGKYHTLKVIRENPIGLFLEDGENGILLPRRFVPANTRIGDDLKVFVYFDSEDRPIATTQKPYGVLGDIVKLRVVGATHQGAFLDWGLMKDLFIPKSQMLSHMVPGGEYIVKIVRDEKTGRLAATERIEQYLSNEDLTVSEKEEVDLLVYRRTDLGYEMIINNVHKGILHQNEIYRDIYIGEKFKGFIKAILPENKIDVVAGRPGYERVEDASDKVLRLLRESDGYLPYYDKSSPEDIYSYFKMSKKTFKMATGKLFKERKIEFTKAGIKLPD